MAKTLVFEGCESCKIDNKKGISGFGAITLPMGIEASRVKDMVQGGAIGAGAATVVDMILPKIPFISTLSSRTRSIALAGLFGLASAAYYRKNPEIATGLGVGGVSIAVYKLIASFTGKLAMAPTAGYGELEIEEYGQDDDFELETEGMGVIVPIEETAGMGVLEASEMDGFGYEEEILVD